MLRKFSKTVQSWIAARRASSKSTSSFASWPASIAIPPSISSPSARWRCCSRIALDMAPETIATCLLAGRVHDIGKLAISRGILLKPGRPTESRMGRAQAASRLRWKHAQPDCRGCKHLAPIVVAHHERIDGEGYPHGLAGHEIPIESQIIAIADAFCAMTVPRPYCATRLPNEAIAELRALRRHAIQCGSQSKRLPTCSATPASSAV